MFGVFFACFSGLKVVSVFFIIFYVSSMATSYWGDAQTRKHLRATITQEQVNEVKLEILMNSEYDLVETKVRNVLFCGRTRFNSLCLC